VNALGKTRRAFGQAAASLCALLAVSMAASAQDWPGKPVRVIVPYPAGGVVDIQARALTQRLATDLGQPFLIENRPGANANIGAEAVARAPADGYTVLVSAPFVVNNPILEQGLRWTPSQLEPVARFSVSPGFLVVPADSPIRSFADFIDRARRANPPLRYGDAGAGNTGTVALDIMRREAGFKVESILYKGLPPVIPDLLNGSLDFSFLPMTLAKAQVDSGRIRALANLASARAPALPDVPTMAELGMPAATVLSWYGLHLPAGTSSGIIARLESAVRAATATDEVQSRFAAGGGMGAFLGRAEFIRALAAEQERMIRLSRP
jgi:tripartite-type tricarboxylate transporter receptor subunit TctC